MHLWNIKLIWGHQYVAKEMQWTTFCLVHVVLWSHHKSVNHLEFLYTKIHVDWQYWRKLSQEGKSSESSSFGLCIKKSWTLQICLSPWEIHFNSFFSFFSTICSGTALTLSVKVIINFSTTELQPGGSPYMIAIHKSSTVESAYYALVALRQIPKILQEKL